MRCSCRSENPAALSGCLKGGGGEAGQKRRIRRKRKRGGGERRRQEKGEGEKRREEKRGREGREQLSGHIFLSELKSPFRIYFLTKNRSNQDKICSQAIGLSDMHLLSSHCLSGRVLGLGDTGGLRGSPCSEATEEDECYGLYVKSFLSTHCHVEARNPKSFPDSLVAGDPDMTVFLLTTCMVTELSHVEERQAAVQQAFCCVDQGKGGYGASIGRATS